MRSRRRLRAQCEEYAASHASRNLDHCLDSLVYDSPFGALVIIDELREKGGRVKAPPNLRYTTRERLLSAKTPDDVW